MSTSHAHHALNRSHDPVHETVLSIIIVNYNSWPDVVRLVRGLAASPQVRRGDCEIIVVDNASDDGPPTALLSSLQGNASLLVRADNGGFAVGVNEGWRAARGRWLLLLNPDVVAGPELPARVLERIAHHETSPDGAPAIVGFALRNPDGTTQPSVGVDPNLLHNVRGLFLPRARRKYQPVCRVRPGPVPWVTGACVLVDARLRDALVGMDEDFFLYYEEVALCRSARRIGRRVEFDPDIAVVHLHPLQNRPLSPRFRLITRHSLLVFFRKHQPPWQFAVLSRIIAVEALWRLWAGRLWGPPRRAEEGRRLRDIVQRLRRGETVPRDLVRDWAAALEHTATHDLDRKEPTACSPRKDRASPR